MSVGHSMTARDMVPRWRRSASFLNSPEMHALRPHRRANRIESSWFKQSFAQWRENPTVPFAADALAAAMCENISGVQVAELLNFLRVVKTPIPHALRAIVWADDEWPNAGTIEVRPDPSTESSIAYQISYLRGRSRREPRNALLWHDLAWCYAAIGEAKRAERAIRSAVQVGGESRAIRRSATRFFSDAKDYDSALHILGRLDSIRSDPWLLAAHMAASRAAQRETKLRKTARSLVKGLDFSPLQLSELAASLATDELYFGGKKQVRRLIAQSLEQPTDNSLAQAVWIGEELNQTLVKHDQINEVSGSYEAAARQAYSELDWAACLADAKLWQIDEPFSIEAAALGGYVACTFLQDFEASENISRRGLVANPKSALLRNNLIVSLCEQSKVDEASKEYHGINSLADAANWTSMLEATNGLLLYRHGNIEAAREQYANAIATMRRKKTLDEVVVAMFYQAREEMLVGDIERAGQIILEGSSLAKQASPEVATLLEIAAALLLEGSLLEITKT
jgi:tetratricopeptide (TPR) repeat protein